MDERYSQPPSNRPEDDFEAAGQSMKEYMQQVEPLQRAKRKRRKGWLVFLIILLILAVAGAAAYWYMYVREEAPGQAVQETEREEEVSQPADELEDVPLKEYSSSGFGLTFEFPENWRVQETADGSRLTAVSPAVQFMDTTNKIVTGQITLSIRDKSVELTEFADGNAVAVRESERMSYARPSSNQRGQTYLSFLGFIGSAGGIDGVYITGDTGYQEGQAVPAADFVPVEPIISLTFQECVDSECTAASEENVSVDPGSWEYNPVLKQAKSILESLTIR